MSMHETTMKNKISGSYSQFINLNGDRKQIRRNIERAG